jgi:hypothetical protein
MSMCLCTCRNGAADCPNKTDTAAGEFPAGRPRILASCFTKPRLKQNLCCCRIRVDALCRDGPADCPHKTDKAAGELAAEGPYDTSLLFNKGFVVVVYLLMHLHRDGTADCPHKTDKAAGELAAGGPQEALLGGR